MWGVDAHERDHIPASSVTITSLFMLGGGETASRNDGTFFRELMPRWETALLPWDNRMGRGQTFWGQTWRVLDQSGPRADSLKI